MTEPKDSRGMTLVFAGIASMCAGGTTHPLDTCKIRLQKQGKPFNFFASFFLYLYEEYNTSLK